MKILIADILINGENSDWKEGYELCYAFRNLGHECDVYGPNGQKSELEIPLVAHLYDLIIITENYPSYSGWKWWNWSEINTPKLFWAIDTHLINFLPWIQSSKINYVAFNNPEDLTRYNLPNSFWLPYGASKTHHMIKYSTEKTRDLVFIGGMLPERKRLCDKFNIEHLNVFGPNYIKEMQSSKICFNLSMSYDINAKYFEILSTGSFMLTNYNKHFHQFLDNNPEVEKMFYYSEEDLGKKIEYYLKNEDEREYLAKKVYDYIYENHTYDSRASLILQKISLNNE